MSVVVECTNCGKKLKLKDPKPGKKLRCPGCKEPFVPQLSASKPGAARRPKKRPAAPVEDDFSDDFADEELDDDDGFDDLPATPRAAKGDGRKKGKTASQGKKSNKLVVIGAGVVSFVLAFIAAFMVVSGGGGPDEEIVAEPDSTQEVAAVDTPTAAPSVDTPEAVADVPVDDEGPAAAKVNLPWLAPDSEVVVQVDFTTLKSGPVGMLIQNPMLAQPIHEFREKAGFGIEDLDSVILGLGDVSKAIELGPQVSSEGAMALEMPGVVVLKVNAVLDSDRLARAIPGCQSVTEGKITFLRVQSDQPPESQPVVWVADENTIVITEHSSLMDVVKRQASELSLPTSLLSGSSAINIAFMPQQPDKVFRSESLEASESLPSDGLMGDVADFLSVVQPVISGFRIGLDITDDIVVSGVILADGDDGAKATSGAMKKLIGALNQALMSDDTNVPLPPMLTMMSSQIGPVLDSFTTEAAGSGAQFSFTATGAGQQVAAFGPMVIGPVVAQAQAEAQRIQNRDNLQNIATAMRNFLNVYERFPNAASRNDRDEKLLSWRVHLLPFLGYESLYEQFALNEPWDSVHNKPLVSRMPDIFRSKAVEVELGMTLFQVPVGRKMTFESAKGRSLKEITDDPANTILILEVSPERATYWTQPDDFKVSPVNPMDGLGGVVADGFRAALVDGSVTSIESTIDPATLRAMYTINGGEAVSR